MSVAFSDTPSSRQINRAKDSFFPFSGHTTNTQKFNLKYWWCSNVLISYNYEIWVCAHVCLVVSKQTKNHAGWHSIGPDKHRLLADGWWMFGET